MNSYDVIRDNLVGGGEMLNVKEEKSSTMQKRLKENQECTNGDYYLPP